MPQKRPAHYHVVNPGDAHPQGWDVPPVNDLRSAIALLKTLPGHYLETDRETDPIGELAGVYRHIGAGGTVMRPTRTGPAMLFNNIKGFPDARVLVGMLASRERVSALLGAPVRELGIQMAEARRNVTPPVMVKQQDAPCQEVVHRADEAGFDLRNLLPAPTNTAEDAGPYFCMGLVLGSDPDDQDNADVTIHRLCVQGKDELSIFFAPGRHIDVFRQKAEAAGKPLPVSINMGLDPAIYIGAEFEAPTTPFGFNELCVAGGLRGQPVELVECLTVRQRAIARAEIVIEGEILPGVRVEEDQNTHTGKAMPEFPGYTGEANPSLPVIKVKAVTTRKNPILQTLVGPGEEHVSLAGIPTEASIHIECQDALPGLVKNVYAHSAGGGKFLAILQVQKRHDGDDGMTRQAALIALAVYRELKNVILVDEDVDLFDTDDVLWAMQTRFSGDMDAIFVPGVAGHVLDPSQTPQYDPRVTAKGTTTKTIFDCTVPFHLKEHFVRAQFQEVDPSLWAPSLFGKTKPSDA
ncbi:3,4-dihydroxybenzoate decarboxylase [Chimaeribacter arupi]|uniref:3,4-dihydroxybenzoate decarboxylase n=2 Tax=Yersiniaceae TaxID=1903411 RepID=A0A2N5ENM0_9GAMM|nr:MULTISPECIES: UbiD family decarboxylase [Yersiniaceae]MBS0969539.1 UbiD family decarboxylase [Nissabacter archeti]MDV5140309.1 UbiD family decarboxylase [Chimaeribacter arupi]PLR30585.1 3,4-dihydroxybenzoate decarboxylase [Chimaeribacter arupi]PLR47624.1 3,4-dihydroxybenzoate decarboxylase [Chimaeribacter arupi]PLR50281.1 3,4-dihydroxybenzoate decarboxylase [Chimaeribacter arupi]